MHVTTDVVPGHAWLVTSPRRPTLTLYLVAFPSQLCKVAKLSVLRREPRMDLSAGRGAE
jgi:hypothetical protein